jgi:hypothetical protein
MQCFFAARAAVPAHPEVAVFEVEEQKVVRAQVAQGIAWPPPRAEAEDSGVGRSLRSNAGILSPPRALVKTIGKSSP